MGDDYQQGTVQSAERSSLHGQSYGGPGQESPEEHAEDSDELGSLPPLEGGNAESEPASNPVSELPPDIAALAHYITYRPDEWRGVTPLQFLENFCAENKVRLLCDQYCGIHEGC